MKEAREIRDEERGRKGEEERRVREREREKQRGSY